MSSKIDVYIVEAEDREICASGFDNLLLSADQERLRDYHEMLVELKAEKCATIVKELIDWIDSDHNPDPLSVVFADKKRYHNLWRQYDDASCDEDPHEMANAL